MKRSIWRRLPGLAGGIDKGGQRAADLLGMGFGSVEFGTVTPLPEADHNPGVAVLVERLSSVDRRHGETRIGISLGAGSTAPPAALTAEWLAGMHAAWHAADYLCFNLSARAYRPLLETRHANILQEAIATIVAERGRLARSTGREVSVALKLPLGTRGAPLPEALATVAGMGLDALIAVLPENEERLAVLGETALLCHGRLALIVVGGIRSADDVRAALATGADGIQVHSAFVEHGINCLPALLDGLSAARPAAAVTP